MKAKVAVVAIVAGLAAGVGNANETANAPVSMHNVRMLEENLSDSASGPNVEHWERGGGGRWERGGGGRWERGGGGRWERGGGGGGWERRHWERRHR